MITRRNAVRLGAAPMLALAWAPVIKTAGIKDG